MSKRIVCTNGLTLVDLFCGLGGVTAAALELGWQVIAAINHWTAAIRTHGLNHPWTLHLQQHLHSGTNWSAWEYGVPDLLWASCACQGHSSAAQPSRNANAEIAAIHDSYRMTMWCVIQAATAWLPPAIAVENVPAVLNWPQLCAWEMALTSIGYKLFHVKLTASRWGVPQRRRRVFFLAIRGRGADKKIAELQRLLVDPRVPEPPIGPHLDFSFRTNPWIPFEELGSETDDKVILRAEEAHRRFRGGPCWIQNVSSKSVWGRSIDEPVTTVTGANQHALVKKRRYRLFTIEETLATQGLESFEIPEDITKTDALTLIANAVPKGLARGVLGGVAAVL